MTKHPQTQHFRAGVGAVILHPNLDRVLFFERSDSDDEWQFPQGGLDVGEEPMQGVLREIKEETGLAQSHIELLPIGPALLSYEFPPEYRSEQTLRGRTPRGQTQWWFFFKFVGDESAINLGDAEEFKRWRWATMGEAVERVVGFKKPVYSELQAHLENSSIK